MDTVRIELTRTLRAAWRRRWIGAVVAWVACGAGWLVVLNVPDQYESSPRLFVDADAVLTPLLRGLTADSSPTTQLEILQRTLLSRPNLEKLVSKTDLDLAPNGLTERERLLTRLATDIKVVSQTKNLFTIAYRSDKPRLARDVVQTLLNIFVESATGTSRSDMENARTFLEREIRFYEQQLRAAEKRRADFRAKYLDVLPNENAPNTSATEGARSLVQQLDGRLQDALGARDALKQEVRNTPPLVVVETGGVAGTGGGTDLREAEERLQALRLTDTEAHPDVVAQRKLVEALRAAANAGAPGTRAGKSATRNRAETAGGAKRSVPNPVYDQLKVRLIEADTNVASLSRQRNEAMRFRDELAATQREQPNLIAEYQNMDRDYAVLRRNYEELLGRLQEANIAEAADTEADKVKLQVIDPPTLPRLPVAPNRLLLISAVLLGGLGCGVVVTVLLDQLDTSFSSIDDLRGLGMPVAGGISVLGEPPWRGVLATAVRFGFVLAVLVCIYGVLVVHALRSAALI